MGFYGNLANVARTTFSFDKTYSTHFEMVLKEASDQVFVGRYVLLDYDHEDDVNDDLYKLTQLVQYLIKTDLTFNWDIIEKIDNKYRQAYTGEEITLNNDTYYILIGGDSASLQNPKLLKGAVEQTVDLEEPISDWYNSHYYIDKKIFSSVGRGWDSTVWQKTYKDDNLAYVMIAELNGVVPTIDILNDPPIWLSEIGSNNSDLIDGEYTYRTTEKYMAPYFDEEDKTNLYYRLHVQSPWKFGIGDITGLPENKGDKVSLHYTKSEKDDYSYGVGKTGTAVDTIKFDFALPSIGNALDEIKTLLYGGGDTIIDPANQGTENDGINDITYYPDLNPGAFTSVAGALNTLYTALGSNITDSYIVKNGENCFPEGYIYYASYAQLIGLSDVDSNYVSTEGVDTNSDNKYYWYQYNDIDNYDPKKKYRILEGYPSYNKVLLTLGQQTADALDLVSDLQNLANEKVGPPGSLMFTDSDYRAGGATLVGDDAIIVNEPTYSSQRNYLPYPNWSMTGDNGGKIYGQIKENGLTFTITDKKTFTVEGTATADTEEIIATNVYLPQGNYLFTGAPKEVANMGCRLIAIKDDTDTRNDLEISGGGEAEIKISSDDFYFDIVKICVDEGASFDVAVEFTPMIKLATDTNTEYVPYQNEYEINIEHKKTELDKTNELYGSSNLWTPLIDDYGHVTGINPVDLPNYYSKILLRNESQSGKVSEITLTPTKDGDLLDLTQIDGMNFRTEKEDDETKILFRPTVDVTSVTSDPIFQTEEANIGNENQWRKFPVVTGVGFNKELNSLDVRRREIPFPLTHISIASRPTYTQEDTITPIDFDWGSDTNPGLVGTTGIYEPEYRAYSKTATSDKEPSKILTFSPADDIIKLGIWQDASQVNPTSIADARRIVIGHGRPTNLRNKNLIIGEVNNLISRQESRIPDIITKTPESGGEATIEKFKTTKEIIQYSDPITETVNLTPADNADGIFSTLSLQLDKAGHVINMKEINVKLVLNTLMKTLITPKAISPWCTSFYHNNCVDSIIAEEAGLPEAQQTIPKYIRNNTSYGAFLIGDRIYLNEGESVKDYSYIAVRAGVNNDHPAGGGHIMRYFPSWMFHGSPQFEMNYHVGLGTYYITFTWGVESSRDKNGKNIEREYIEIIGNMGIYHVSDNDQLIDTTTFSVSGTNNTFTLGDMRGNLWVTAGQRDYAYKSDNNNSLFFKEDGANGTEYLHIKRFATVSQDTYPKAVAERWIMYERINGVFTKVTPTVTLWDYINWDKNHPWIRSGNSSTSYVQAPIWPGEAENTYHNKYKVLRNVRAAERAGRIGIRAIYGIGPASDMVDDSSDPDFIPSSDDDSNLSSTESSIDSTSSSSEETYWSGSGSGN